MSIFDPFSPYCLALFTAGFLALLSNTWPVRSRLARLRGGGPAARVDDLDAYEEAYLLGFGPRAVYVALASLQAQGCIAVRERQRTLVATGVTPADAHPLELAVLRALDTLDEEQRYGDAIAGALFTRLHEPLRELEARVERRGLVVATARSQRQQRRSVYGFLALAFVALVVAMIGTSHEHVPWAMFGVMAACVACAFVMVVWRQVRPPAGARAAKALIASGAGGHVPRRPAVLVAAGTAGGEDGDRLAALRRVLTAPSLPGALEEADEPAWDPALAEGAAAPAETGAWGYVAAGQPHGCTQHELVAMCAEGRTPRLVWTPASPLLVHPADVPFLFERLRAARAARRVRPLRDSAMQAGMFAVLWATSHFAIPSFWMVMLAAESFALVPAWREWRKAKALTAAELRTPAPPVQFSEWALRVRTKKVLYTPALCLALLPVGLVQLIPGLHSIEAAGLVKEAVRHGQWWRMLTAPTLHGNIFHFVGNYAALTLLGGLVERHGRRWHMPAVLVVSAIGGSVASQLLSAATSVGVSGGIMGCLGYLLVVGWRYRKSVAPGFFRAMLYSAAIIGFVGLLGYGVIDNAAHGGGLVAGILTGLVLVPRRGLDEVEEPERATRGGWAWSSLFFAFCALAIVMIVVRG